MTTVHLSCRFGGRCRPAVPAAWRGVAQDTLKLLEEDPFLQTAGRLQNILAWVPQKVQAKSDLWVSSASGSHVSLHNLSKKGFNLRNAKNRDKLHNTPTPLSSVGYCTQASSSHCLFDLYILTAPFRSQQNFLLSSVHTSTPFKSQ